MSKTHQKPALSLEKQAAIAEIRDRARKDRAGRVERIDRGELGELVPHARSIELRAGMVGYREVREPMGFSLTDLSERTGLTRATIRRPGNGWNLNPTLETLFRSTEALGVGLKFVMDEQTKPGEARGTWSWSSSDRGTRRTSSRQGLRTTRPASRPPAPTQENKLFQSS